jgi:glycerophosphoryl diester phosphodiesterase
LGDLGAELTAYLEAGIDGFFTDHPDLGVRIRDEFVKRK